MSLSRPRNRRLTPALVAASLLTGGCASSRLAGEQAAYRRDAAADAELIDRAVAELDRVRAVLAADLAEQARKDEQIAGLQAALRSTQARLDAAQAVASLTE